MKLNIKRPGIGRYLAIDGTREELEAELFKDAVKPGMVVLDLGANIGYYTLIAASIVRNTGKVYAVEPFPTNFENLKDNIRRNNFDNIVECYQLALSDKNGESDLFIGQADNVHTLINQIEKENDGKNIIKVKTSSVDSFLSGKKKIDFLRMDIEGSECEVFDGMKKTFMQTRPPRIMFEVHPLGDIDPDPRFTPRLKKFLNLNYIPHAMVSSFHPQSLKSYSELGYHPRKMSKSGQGLFYNIHPDHLLKLAARRPKITRAIYLVHESDML